MPFMCAICRDSLERGMVDLNISKEQSFSIVTSCGHLFHFDCLPTGKFLVSKGADGKVSITFKSGESMNCGTCNGKVISVMRIYPSVEDAIETDSELMKKANQQDEIFKLRARIRVLEMRLQRGNEGGSSQLRDSGSTEAPVLRIDRNTAIVLVSTTEGGLRVGHRVVWCVENLEVGTVKWLGDINGNQYAGVEFEQPISNYYVRENNYYPDIKFKVGHGRLVRVQELVTHSEFYGTVAV